MSSTPHFPLFDAYPTLGERVARVSLGDWPTPIAPLQRFGAAHGLAQLFIKREDLSHPVCAGNKLRGLEFLLAEALRLGKKSILTVGAAGSHHIARTAWHASQLGIRTIALILRQPMAEYVRRNLRAAASVNARLILASPLTIVPRLLALHYLAADHPYFIAPGGTTPLACLGHVNAAFELKRQIDERALPSPDYLFAPLGSLGTVAGLVLGCKLAGLKTRIVGGVTSYRWYATPGRVARWARKVNAFMRRIDARVPDANIASHAFDVVTGALGPGYAHFTPEAVHLAEQMHETEQIEMDGTYSAKALNAALAYIRDRGIDGRVHLLWHTYQRFSIKDSPTRFISPQLAEYLREPAQSLDDVLQRTIDRTEEAEPPPS